jgi:hypothetical protein
MAHLRWAKGGEARIVALDDDRIDLASTSSSAPGSRIDGVLPSASTLRVKVHRCRKVGDGFAIEGRTIDLRREVRAEILGLLGAPAPAGDGEAP